MLATTLDVIKLIVRRNPDIKWMRLISYLPQKDLAADFSEKWTQEDDILYKSALSLREKIKLPFWNSLMLSIINASRAPINCLKGTVRHHPIEEVGWIEASAIDEIEHAIFHEGRMAFNSQVLMKDGEFKHIPMLDFHIPYSEKNTTIVKNVCELLRVHGSILKSGKSYHFIGYELMDYNELTAFLGRALLFEPIVDSIWLAHQLQDGSCSLRFGIKHGIIPIVLGSV